MLNQQAVSEVLEVKRDQLPKDEDQPMHHADDTAANKVKEAAANKNKEEQKGEQTDWRLPWDMPIYKLVAGTEEVSIGTLKSDMRNALIKPNIELLVPKPNIELLVPG